MSIFRTFLLASLGLLLTSACKPPVSAYKVANTGGSVPAERYTVRITAPKTYFKISTDQAVDLQEHERCDVVKDDVLKYVGALTYEGVHARLTLHEISLPQCPFRTGFLYNQHFEENSGTANTEYVYPLGNPSPTCQEAGGGSGAFAAGRDGGYRKHAGCDLYSSIGTPVYAVEDGVVLDIYNFVCDTDAIEVKGSRVVRYSELDAQSYYKHNVQVGQLVKKGQIIAEVGLPACLTTQAMLHFELYQGSALGLLTQEERLPFKRRADLLDPTQGLFQWRRARFQY